MANRDDSGRHGEQTGADLVTDLFTIATPRIADIEPDACMSCTGYVCVQTRFRCPPGDMCARNAVITA